MGTFYSIAGQNGLAVASSWEKAQEMRKYIYKAEIKSFETFEDAENWAILEFSQRVPPEYQVVTYLKLDRAVFKKYLRPDYI